MTKEVYEGMTLAKLKEVAKELGVKNISKYKKSELIEEILKNNDNIKAVLNFLIIAGRDIIISYNFKKTPYFILGNGILGYDTYVKKGN